MPINQSGCQLQCFECGGWGHKKGNCPNKIAKKITFWPPLPTQREAFLNRNKNQSIGQASTLPKNIKVNYVSIKEEQEEQAKYYDTLDPSEPNQQYSILEEPWSYEEGILDESKADFEEKLQD